MLRLCLIAAVICACSAVPDRSKRAAGGENTWLSERSPWLVQIETEAFDPKWNEKRFKADTDCLGALINPIQVLTPAHCVDSSAVASPRDIAVRAGSDYTKAQLFSEGIKYKFYDLLRNSKVAIHPDYKKGSPAYDLALLTLNEPFKLATDKYDHDRLKAIDIATAEQVAAATHKPETAGFGKKFDQMNGSLRRLYLNRLSKEECGEHFVESQICFETENGNLDEIDIGAPAWLAKTQEEIETETSITFKQLTPPLLVGINTAIYNDNGRNIALFTDLTDPKVAEFIKKNWSYKKPSVLSKLFG